MGDSPMDVGTRTLAALAVNAIAERAFHWHEEPLTAASCIRLRPMCVRTRSHGRVAHATSNATSRRFDVEPDVECRRRVRDRTDRDALYPRQRDLPDRLQRHPTRCFQLQFPL